ncbi:MAG TPA: alpha/beta hydrolase [Acidimicrobiales bacterium]
MASETTGAAFERLQIPAGGFTFDALAAGPEDGHLVFLLHGFPQSAYEWKAQLVALGEAGYRAVAPNQRGYSPGARPEEVSAYAIDALAGDVIAMADELGAHQFHVVGHDWGAGVVWYLAGHWASRLRSATVVSVPHPQAFAAAYRGEIGGNQKEMSGYMDFFRMEGTAEDTMLPGLRDMFVGSDLPADAIEEHLRVVGERAGLTGGLNWYRANYIEKMDVPVVETPLLFIWSSGDVFLGREAAEATGDYVKGQYRFEIIDGVDHWVPEKAPDRVNELVLEHLAANS